RLHVWWDIAFQAIQRTLQIIDDLELLQAVGAEEPVAVHMHTTRKKGTGRDPELLAHCQRGAAFAEWAQCCRAGAQMLLKRDPARLVSQPASIADNALRGLPIGMEGFVEPITLTSVCTVV